MRLPEYRRQTTAPGPAGLQAIDTGEGVFGQAVQQTTNEVMGMADKINQTIAASEFSSKLLQFKKGMAQFYEEHIYGNPNPDTYQELYEEFVANGLYEEVFSSFRNGSAQRMFEEQGAQLLEQNRAQVAQQAITRSYETGRQEMYSTIEEALAAGDYGHARLTLQIGLDSGTLGASDQTQIDFLINKTETLGNIRSEAFAILDTEGFEAAKNYVNEPHDTPYVFSAATGETISSPLFTEQDRASLQSALKAEYDYRVEQRRKQQEAAVQEEEGRFWAAMHGPDIPTPDVLLYKAQYDPEWSAAMRSYDEFGNQPLETLIRYARTWQNQLDSEGDGWSPQQDASEQALIMGFIAQINRASDPEKYAMWDEFERLVDPTGKEPGEYIRIRNARPIIEELGQQTYDDLKDISNTLIDMAKADEVFGDPGDPEDFRPEEEVAIRRIMNTYIDHNRQNLGPVEVREHANKIIDIFRSNTISNFLTNTIHMQVFDQVMHGAWSVDSAEEFQAAIDRGDFAAVMVPDDRGYFRPSDDYIAGALDKLHLDQAQALGHIVEGVTPEELGRAVATAKMFRTGQAYFRLQGRLYTFRMEGKDERIYVMPYVEGQEPDSWDRRQWTDITDQARAQGRFQSGGEGRNLIEDAIRNVRNYLGR